MRVAIMLAALALSIAFGGPVAAQQEDAKEPVPGVDEPIGSWRFRTDRPVKAVVVGGSIAAYQGGNFGDFIEQACRNTEVVNVAKARYGGWALKKRFEAQVLKNRRIDLDAQGVDAWVIFQGGLNSVASPEKTNRDLLALFRMAHDAKMKVVGLTLSPWGTEGDSRRWTGTAGIAYQDFTRKVVDFVLGRLAPQEALGRYAGDRTAFEPGDLPDVAVDLYDSPLRDADAPLRDQAKMEREVERSSLVKKRLAAQPEAEREAERSRLLQQAREIPQWFLRSELHSFDHIHPNADGHRIIAAQICPRVPASWGCDCSLLEPEAPAVPQATR
jgi:hypothetical protein